MGILGLGIFMTYRILNFPDMTTEGSFSSWRRGLCDCYHARCLTDSSYSFRGWCGDVSGLVTGLLYTKGKIPVILAGILVMSGLNSVMLFVMRSPNLSLLNQPKIQDFFTKLNLPNYFDTVLIGLVMVLVIGAVLLFFSIPILGKPILLQETTSIWLNH